MDEWDKQTRQVRRFAYEEEMRRRGVRPVRRVRTPMAPRRYPVVIEEESDSRSWLPAIIIVLLVLLGGAIFVGTSIGTINTRVEGGKIKVEINSGGGPIMTVDSGEEAPCPDYVSEVVSAPPAAEPTVKPTARSIVVAKPTQAPSKPSVSRGTATTGWSLSDTTLAVVYGCPGGAPWGTLSCTSKTPDGARQTIPIAVEYAKRVDSWNGAKGVIPVVNPVTTTNGKQYLSDDYIKMMIEAASQSGVLVMFDIHGGSYEHLMSMVEKLTLLGENVTFDYDLEFNKNITPDQIQTAAKRYFAIRKEAGYSTPGVFAAYIFLDTQMQRFKAMERTYDGGWIIPIYDGYGGGKLNAVGHFWQIFGSPAGAMEFETKWHGTKYADNLDPAQILAKYPDLTIMASQ